mgnify:CR=1 FL=1
MENINVYIIVLHDSLSKKVDIVKKILKCTKEQNVILSSDEVNVDRFNDLISEKDILLKKLEELDNGFDTTFDRVKEELKNNKDMYKSQILEMQNYIRVITDMSVEIESLERSNKTMFADFLHGKRKEIRKFNVNNKIAASYNSNMPNQHQDWQSYFLDKKK